jgi:predicted nucleotidyltransferase
VDLKYTKPRSAEELMEQNLLVKHYAGSHAYGTNIATSDVDFRGIFVCDPVNLLTPFFTIREATDVKEEDTKFYELSHFMKLCLDCNPNIVETLWVDNGDLEVTSPAYVHLRNHRHELLSSKVAFTFSGYATAQLKRIKGHNKWINNPQPSDAPTPCQFLSVVQWLGDNKNLHPNIRDFLLNHRLVPFGGNIYGVAKDKGRTLWDADGSLNDIIESGDREKYREFVMIIKWNKEVYKEAKEKHKLYWEWKKNRNKVRAELEERYGFDGKHASHLVRLLRMGEEILTTGKVIVKRPDAEELLSIRNGAWTYEEVVAYAEEMDRKVREVLYKTTDLPKKPDIKNAAKLLMETQEIVWG